MNIVDYCYTPLFCEENIWLLTDSLHQEGYALSQIEVLILSNPNKQIVLFEQNAAPLGQPVLWDYHVILYLNTKPRALIFDFDSRLPFPCPAHQYFHSSLPQVETLPNQYFFYIRQIPAEDYLTYFYSDRRHMSEQISEQQFPPYAIIQPPADQQKILLSEYWDMEKLLPDNSTVYPYSEVFKRLV